MNHERGFNWSPSYLGERKLDKKDGTEENCYFINKL